MTISLCPESINPFACPSLPLEQRSQLPTTPAVYFALSDNEVLYIGHSANLRRRWVTHHKCAALAVMGGVRIAWLVSAPEYSDAIAAALIQWLEPCLNQVQPCNNDYLISTNRAFFRVATLRQVKGISQDELASRLEISLTDLQHIESNRVKPIRADTLDRLCEVLECEFGDLFVEVPAWEYIAFPSDVDLLALPSLLLVERRQLPSLSAVYFVLDGIRILDIGKSTNLAQKWKAYRGLRQLKDRCGSIRIAWLECDDTRLLSKLESALIDYFKPEISKTKAFLSSPQKAKGVLKNRIKEFVDSRKLTIRQFWKDIGISRTTAYALYNNPDQYLAKNVMNAVCTTYRVQPGELMVWVPDSEVI